MKKFFYIGLFGLLLSEFLTIYFIMPMPGSQTMDSIGLAYFLNSNRWIFRIVWMVILLAGSRDAFGQKRKWVPLFCIIIAAIGIYLFNFHLSADKMFLQSNNIVLKSQTENKIPGSRLIIGIENKGEAKAYPIEFLAYHHQVQDSIGGKPVMVTYCSVCRTGRVYEPIVNGHYEKFRLVGMDHFNAMFEDATTHSWWRQTTGEAIVGDLKGKVLPELESKQMTIDKWFELYPQAKVMQMDSDFISIYDSLANFEKGKSKGSLTRTDSVSWNEKSWVVGIKVGNYYKAYDWNDLKKKKIITDKLGQTSLIIILSKDGQSFAAFEIPSTKVFTLNNDTLFTAEAKYDFSGQNITTPSDKLQSIKAYQEFWHSWFTFHPATEH